MCFWSVQVIGYLLLIASVVCTMFILPIAWHYFTVILPDYDIEDKNERLLVIFHDSLGICKLLSLCTILLTSIFVMLYLGVQFGVEYMGGGL